MVLEKPGGEVPGLLWGVGPLSQPNMNGAAADATARETVWREKVCWKIYSRNYSCPLALVTPFPRLTVSDRSAHFTIGQHSDSQVGKAPTCSLSGLADAMRWAACAEQPAGLWRGQPAAGSRDEARKIRRTEVLGFCAS